MVDNLILVATFFSLTVMKLNFRLAGESHLLIRAACLETGRNSCPFDKGLAADVKSFPTACGGEGHQE